MAAEQSGSPPRRKKRKWIVACAVVVGLLIVLIVALPTLISMGVGNGLIRSAINKSINGTVALGDVNLGWFSGQSVKGLTITDQRGAKAVDLNLAVDSGLFSLLIKRSKSIDVTISGTINGEVKSDNSLSLQDLVVASPKPAHPPAAPKPAKPFQLPNIPGLTLHVNGLTLNVKNAATAQVLALNNLTGTIAVPDPTQPISIDLHGKTAGKDATGSLDITGTAAGLFTPQRELSLRGASAKLDVQMQTIPLPIAVPGFNAPAQVQLLKLNLLSDDLTGKIVISFDMNATVEGHESSHMKTEATISKLLTSNGELTMRGATAHVNIDATNLPLPAGDVRGSVRSLAVVIASEDLTKSIDLALQGQTQVESFDPSPLTGKLAIDQLFTPNAGVTFAIERLTGNIAGKTIPTAIAQPFLSSTPIIASRDIGPTVDVQATFGSGAARYVTVMASGARARLEVNANVNQSTGAVTGSHVLLSSPGVDPKLIQGLANIVVDRPVDVELQLTAFTLPGKDASTGVMPMAPIAATGTLRMNGPNTIQILAAANPGSTATQPSTVATAVPIVIQSTMVRFDSPGLGKHIDLEGNATIDGGAVRFNQHITNLLAENGELNATSALTAGTFTIEKLPASTLAKFAPDQKQLLDAAIGPVMSVAATTTVDNNIQSANVQAKAKAFQASLSASRKPDAISFSEAHAVLSLTPDVSAALQPGQQSPIVLTTSAANIDVQPFDLPMKSPGSFSLPTQPLSATLAVDDAVVQNAPSLVEPLGVSKLSAKVNVTNAAAGMTCKIDGIAALRRANGNQSLTQAAFVINAQNTNGKLQPQMDLTLTELSVPALEALMGKERGALSDWTGNNGALSLHANRSNDQWQATVKSEMPNIKGDFNASGDSKSLQLTAKPTTILVSRDVLQKRMNAPPAKTPAKTPTKAGAPEADDDETPSEPAQARTIHVDADVPMQLVIKQLKLPMALVQGKPFDPAAANIDLSLAGGPVDLTYPGDVKASLRDMKLGLTSADLAKGVTFAFNAQTSVAAPVDKSAPAAKAPASSVLDVNGKLVDLVNADSLLDMAAAKLQLLAKADAVPTALADAVLDLQGLLVAAVGPQMNATFDADDFSFNSGRVDAKIQATNGWLNAFARGKNQTLRVAKTKPIEAELSITPPLRERLLQKIHPILADIRTTEHPLKVSIPYAIVPAGGDVSKLKADIQITIGKVALDSGSTTLALLNFFQQKGKETIPGEIDPISITIRNGIVKYEKFTVHIEKFTMNYSGEINLVKQTVNLKTEVPLKALGQAVKELEPYADKIVVPLVTRGKFGDVKTKIDPDFDLGKAALDAGFKGGLEDLLKGKGGKGGLLDDIIKGLGKKK